MIVYLKTAVLMVVILILGYILTFAQWRVIDGQILETFFSAFGTIYAIVIGFVIYQVTNYYNELKSYIVSEINAIQDLRDFLVFIDDHDDIVKDVIEKLNVYVMSIIKVEWPDMISQSTTSMKSSGKLYEVMKSVNKINPDNQSDIVALEKLIHTTSEITTYRTNRLNESKENLPPLLKQLVIMLSTFIVIAFTFVPIDEPVVRVILTAAIAFAVSLIYFVIIDLDNAYTGTWAVSNQQYVDLYNENQAYLEKYKEKVDGEVRDEPKPLVIDQSKSYLSGLFTRSTMFVALLGLLGVGAISGNYQVASDLSKESHDALQGVLADARASEPLSPQEIARLRGALLKNIQANGGLRYAYLPLPEHLEEGALRTTLSSKALLPALSLLGGDVERAMIEVKIFEIALYEANLIERATPALPPQLLDLEALTRDLIETVRGDPQQLDAASRILRARLSTLEAS